MKEVLNSKALETLRSKVNQEVRVVGDTYAVTGWLDRPIESLPAHWRVWGKESYAFFNEDSVMNIYVSSDGTFRVILR